MDYIRVKQAERISGIKGDTIKYHIKQGHIAHKKVARGDKKDIDNQFSFYYLVSKRDVLNLQDSYSGKAQEGGREECKTCVHNKGRCTIYIDKNNPIVRDGICYSYEKRGGNDE